MTAPFDSPPVTGPLAEDAGTADRPRNEALAALLSLLALGLGQVYNGEVRKAVLLNLAALVTFLVVLGLLFSPAFALVMPVAVVVGGGLWVFAFVDAILGSRKRSESYALRPYNRVLVYVAIVVVALVARECVTMVLRSQVVQAFRIPSEAMMPTLLPGDFVFVDKRTSERTPERGDIIAFDWPEDPRRQYLKRVVAVGGDLFEMRDKVAYVNGLPTDERFVVHIDPATHPAESDPRDNFGPYRVPKFSYFVLGDNRDNSNDSRFWGPVGQTLVRGKVRGIYWSWSSERSGPRWERVGRLLR